VQTLTEEGGLTLTEVLVGLVVVATIAAIALPSFRNQGSKGKDSEAKSTVVMTATTIESCATDHRGSYERCSEETLLSMEPSLADAADRIIVVARPNTYEIIVVSPRDPNVSFALSRASNGTTTRTCTTNEDRGGCLVPTTGTW
jgi:prepilin-type N-terminal cleavage/methylation domain-containing protein